MNCFSVFIKSYNVYLNLWKLQPPSSIAMLCSAGIIFFHTWNTALYLLLMPQHFPSFNSLRVLPLSLLLPYSIQSSLLWSSGKNKVPCHSGMLFASDLLSQNFIAIHKTCIIFLLWGLSVFFICICFEIINTSKWACLAFLPARKAIHWRVSCQHAMWDIFKSCGKRAKGKNMKTPPSMFLLIWKLCPLKLWFPPSLLCLYWF